MAVMAITFSFWQQGAPVDTPVAADAGQLKSNRDLRLTPDSRPPAPSVDEQQSSPAHAAIDTKQDGDVLSQWGEFVVFQRVARNCRNVVRNGNKAAGETFLQRICDHDTVAAHPYAEFTTGQLQQIADTDGIAALILGVRLRDQAATIEDYQTAIQHLYTAVALTGEPEVYETLMVEQGILIGTHSNRPEDDLAEKSQAYVWAKAGYDLGLIDSRDMRRARQAILAIDSDAIGRLDSMALQLTEDLRQERVERAGEYY